MHGVVARSHARSRPGHTCLHAAADSTLHADVSAAAKVANDAAAATAAAAGLPAPPKTGFSGVAATNVAAAAADNWAGALFAVPAVLGLVVAAFLREGVQLRAKDKAAGEKWARAKGGWSDPVGGWWRTTPCTSMPAAAGQPPSSAAQPGWLPATDLAVRLNQAVNNWQNGKLYKGR